MLVRSDNIIRDEEITDPGLITIDLTGNQEFGIGIARIARGIYLIGFYMASEMLNF